MERMELDAERTRFPMEGIVVRQEVSGKTWVFQGLRNPSLTGILAMANR